MEYTYLPTTDIRVSKICLGTMTWGRQNTEEEGHAQMDYALSQGVNFFDTAELYPIPAHKDRYALTEKIIGNWFRKTGKRQEVVLASKIAGPAPFTRFIRTSGFHPDAIREAVEGSLKRLQTDYIDLYQLHWPDRPVNKFGQLDYEHDTGDSVPLEESLSALGELVQAGKIRLAGISNETA
ncbi:MAG: aldo/keto reductase, partial [Robiginitalea sp.]|nr:aldo/keto reductase [Robiginitalea sp.]